MDWAEDLKISIRKTTAKMGRRAGQKNLSSQNSSEREESLDIDFDLGGSDGGGASGDSVLKSPPKGKKFGGWADAGIKSGKSRANKNLIEEERFSSTTNTSDQDFIDDIPIIPDLDDIQDELLMSAVVEPPSVSANRVVTLKELNSDLLKQSAFSTLEDLDLSALTKCLQPQNQLDEPDDAWEWEKLFTEVSAEIHVDNNSSTKNDAQDDQTSFVT